jgi:predicted ATP-grasp superfamily ATP-dependent carboligase
MAPRKCSKVLILGAQHPTGLSTARSLKGCGIEIAGIFYHDSPCAKSNVWSKIIKIKRNAPDILKTLDNLAVNCDTKTLVLPADDESVKIISDNREIISNQYILILPGKEIVDLLLDKAQFYEWAGQNGYLVPQTRRVNSFDELNSAIDLINYPLLLKPLYRTNRWDHDIPNHKVFILENEDHLSKLPANLFDISADILVQQWIPGSDSDIYFCLVYYSQNAKLVNYFCGRKIMQWPPLGGSTAVAISDDNDATKDITIALFNKVNYRGLGSVEYKKNPIDNKMYIMEPTVGRNDFQSYLAVTGNTNLTKMAYHDSNGNYIIQQQKRKSYWVSEISFYYGLNYYLKKRDLYIIRFVTKIFRSAGFSIFSMHDIKPFVILIKNNLFRRISKHISKKNESMLGK